MGVPVVAIVGRPNVGKSSLFNRLAGRRIAIVNETPGVTRDRVSTMIEYKRRFFELVDTGGIGLVDVEEVAAEIASQIDLALKKADVVVFVGDVRAGLHVLDKEVAARLRRIAKPVILVANKAELESSSLLAAEFNGLGCGGPLLVSAREGGGGRAR